LVKRFLNEADGQRHLSSQHHRSFDAGVTPEGAPYILMSFSKISLQKRLADKGRLRIAHALRIALQAGSALGAPMRPYRAPRSEAGNLFLVPDASAPGSER